MAHSGGITGNPYRRVHPAIWDDVDFVAATDFDRTLYFLLLTGSQVTALPGLQHEGVLGLAETMRRPADMVRDGLERIYPWAQYNEEARVIWVPNAPKFNEAGSPNHIRAWWNRWSEFPKCQFKQAHLPFLRKYAQLERPAHLSAWNSTFGKVDSVQLELDPALLEPSVRSSEGLNARARAISGSGSGSDSDRISNGGSGGDIQASRKDEVNIVLLADWRPSDRARKTASECGYSPEAVERSAAAMRAKFRQYRSGLQSTLDDMWLASWLRHEDGGHRGESGKRSTRGDTRGEQSATRSETSEVTPARRGPRGSGRLDEVAERATNAELAELSALGSTSKGSG